MSIKTYLGVQSLDGGGVFYFNLNRVSSIKINYIHKESNTWLSYLERCSMIGVEPRSKGYFLNVDNGRKVQTFLISEKKKLQIMYRLKKFLTHDFIEGEEE